MPCSMMSYSGARALLIRECGSLTGRGIGSLETRLAKVRLAQCGMEHGSPHSIPRRVTIPLAHRREV